MPFVKQRAVLRAKPTCACVSLHRMGAPSLVKEGVSWREVRLRALHATPVSLSPLPRETAEAEA